MAATLWPTPAVNRIADDMYAKAVDQAIRFKNGNPHISPLEYTVSMGSFSRGSGPQMNVAWRLEHQGLVTPSGQVIAPPGVPVHQMVMLDPVQTGILGNMCIPPNVKAPILVVESRHERRSQFAVADYGHDPRVEVVRMPGNHAGVGGGQDLGGTGAPNGVHPSRCAARPTRRPTTAMCCTPMAGQSHNGSCRVRGRAAVAVRWRAASTVCV